MAFKPSLLSPAKTHPHTSVISPALAQTGYCTHIAGGDNRINHLYLEKYGQSPTQPAHDPTSSIRGVARPVPHLPD